MTEMELKDRVYEILERRIRLRIGLEDVCGEPVDLQQAVNLIIVNIAVLATNPSKEAAIDHLFETQKKILKGVTMETARGNAFLCYDKFLTEILAFREMHRLLDEGRSCEPILARVQHLLDTDAKELRPEPGALPTPSLEDLLAGGEREDEPSFINRMIEYHKSKRKARKTSS
jgi:hypothetical protein